MAKPDSSRIFIELEEWQEAGPANVPALKGQSLQDDLAAQRIADELRRQVDIRPNYNGLSISTSSFVGRIDIGALRISIRPKLAPSPLAQLLRYAYGLRDVTTREETVVAPTIQLGLPDLLAAMLAAEVEELLHRGLPRRYVPVAEDLESPRGQIQVNELARRGGVTEPLLPCRHFRRDIDWQLNRVLLAGLALGSRVTEDFELRRRLHSLQRLFGEVSAIPLSAEDLDTAENNLTRLTDACRPSLTLIRLLHQDRGVAFQAEDRPVRIPGFLFDMNRFFQRLLSRFLREHLPGMRLEDERRIHGMFSYAPEANPLRRKAPQPRPDFALFRGGHLETFLDAKYRDMWKRGLPAGWLYQLGNYAQASPSRSSTILYPTTEDQAREERINVRAPIGTPSSSAAVVILRPVLLPYLAELVATSRTGKRIREREDYAGMLIGQRSSGERFVPRTDPLAA